MIECPKNGGSAYLNYKGFHSIVLLAVCDAKYCFTFVDIGDYGSLNDASIFQKQHLVRPSKTVQLTLMCLVLPFMELRPCHIF